MALVGRRRVVRVVGHVPEQQVSPCAAPGAAGQRFFHLRALDAAKEYALT
jgi:hypothetical protein